MSNTALQSIKSIVRDFFPDAQVMLFGSRARGEFRKGSDYDVLVITKSSFSPREKISWCTKINKALVQSIRAPVDVLINSEEEVASKQELPGHIIRWAMKEGIKL
ncbi:MAG: nucleotidyltransferase domain-containing protein [Bacteroidetes bacterium]|nr:nucleotidyltransferase domain-containing protein [Bacteroidota bacterium]